MSSLRTYYESCEYETDEPGEYAAITVLADNDGPHIVFSTKDLVILDLPVPAEVALAISFALARAGRATIVAAEHLTERPANPSIDRPAELPAAPLLEPGMTPYGPREIPQEPHKHIDHTRPLPIVGVHPGSLMAASTRRAG